MDERAQTYGRTDEPDNARKVNVAGHEVSWAHYPTPGPAHWELGLVCLGIGGLVSKRVSVTGRTLDCHAGVFVTEGGGRLRAGRVDAMITAPALFWLFPGVPHSYGPGPEGWSERWLLFGGRAATAYETLGYLSHTDPVVQLGDTGPLEFAFAGLHRACEVGAVEAAAAAHQVIVAGRRCRLHAGDDSVLEALTAAARQPLTVTEHARRLGLSVPVLRRAVRRSAGCTPKEFLLRARLSHAKELLATTTLTVAAVANRVGYDDPGYFTRLFTRRVGSAPGRFRADQRR